MFGFRRRENAQVQFYGKLPLAKDYLRLGLGEGPGQLLRDWLDTTFSGASREALPELAWPARFLIGDAWQNCFMGTLVPSTDAGGHRAFPFLVGIERRRRAVLDDLAAGLPVAGVVWQELRLVRERCTTHADGRALLAAERGAEVAVDGGEPPAGIELASWLEALWPGEGRDGFARDFDRLRTVGGDAPLRLPLAPGGSMRQQATAWLEVLQRAGLLDPRQCPTLFFPERSEQGERALFLTVLRSAPRPADGNWLAAGSPGGALGLGDLVAGRTVTPGPVVAAAPGIPPLAASLRGLIAAGLRPRAPDAGGEM